jgi:hypothetical protein
MAEAADEIEEIDASQPLPAAQEGRQNVDDKDGGDDQSKTEPDEVEELKPAPQTPAVQIISPAPRQRETIVQKFMKRMPKLKTPKVHSGSLTSSTKDEVPPPLPTNYPSTEAFLQRIDYRRQKHRYSAEKVEYYLQVALPSLLSSHSS